MSQIYVFFTLFGIILCQDAQQVPQSDAQHINAIYDKCRVEAQITDDDIENFKKLQLPDNRNGRCMVACLMEQIGVISDGKFMKEGAVGVANQYFANKPDELAKANNVIDICENIVLGETDKCDLGGNLIKCVSEESAKVGLRTDYSDSNNEKYNNNEPSASAMIADPESDPDSDSSYNYEYQQTPAQYDEYNPR